MSGPRDRRSMSPQRVKPATSPAISVLRMGGQEADRMRYIMHGESAVEPEIESESSSPQNPTEPTEIKKVIITGLVKRTASAGEQRPAAAEHLPANLEKSCIASQRVGPSFPHRDSH